MISQTELRAFIEENFKTLNLPIVVKNGTDVFQILEKRWSAYLSLVKKTEWLKDCIPNIKFYIQAFKKAKVFYYQGKMIEANKEIIKILNRIKKTKYCNYISEYFIDIESKQWFRARVGKNANFTGKDMWHIPFNKRSLITNQRYSINGIPCLYLASSIFACWEEMDRPTLNEFWVNRFMPITENGISILNLSITLYQLCTYETYYNSAEFVKGFFEAWIVQSACSVRVEEKSRAFKEEYIFPQLIMQNLYMAEIDGVMYFSVKMKKAYSHSCGWIAKQLALPAFDDDSKSLYSQTLGKAFLYSEPLNVELYKDKICYSTVTDTTISENWDRYQTDIYFSEKMYQRYYSTIFYKCELELLQDKYKLFEPVKNKN